MSAPAQARRARLASPVSALVLGCLLLLLAAGLVVLPIMAHQNPLESIGVGLGIAVPFAAVGTVVARRLPRNPIGWLMLAPSLLFLVSVNASSYTVIDYRLGGHLPGGPVAVLLYQAWAPLIALRRCGSPPLTGSPRGDILPRPSGR